jgi:hypothetical protein
MLPKPQRSVTSAGQAHDTQSLGAQRGSYTW